LTFQH